MDSITSEVWTVVPGTADVRIYPIIRKPSCVCCNTYILATPRMIIVLDPGADRGQIEVVRQTLLPLIKKRALPIYIFLTHCHIDHYIGVPGLMARGLDGKLVIHEKTATAIEERDVHITLADMSLASLPECKAFSRIFCGSASSGLQRDPLVPEFLAGEILDLQTCPSLSCAVAERDVMEIFHTPGHSPDGLSYRVGSYLFTGDLHVATHAGIAGKAGWDNVALASSLGGIMLEARQGGVQLVLPGHGLPLPMDGAERVFDAARKDALHLSGLTLLDRARAKDLSYHAIVLLEEAGQLFSIVAARLLKVAHYLEVLEEEEGARGVLGLIDLKAMEQIIDEFYYFSLEVKEERGAPLIAKAVQFSRRVNRIFAPEKVSHLFDRSLIRRIKGLLSDFTDEVYGIRFRNQEMVFDMNLAVERLLASLKELPYDPESIFESIEDHDAYVRELVRRISYEPLFSSITFDLSPSQEAALVVADRERFEDMVTALLEQCAMSTWEGIRLECMRQRGTVLLRVSPREGSKASLQLSDSKASYIRNSMRMAGGDFHATVEDGIDVFLFELPSANAETTHDLITA